MILRKLAWFFLLCKLSFASSHDDDSVSAAPVEYLFFTIMGTKVGILQISTAIRQLEDSAEYLKCNVIVVDTEYGEDTNVDESDTDEFFCNPIVNAESGHSSSFSYLLELPLDFLNNNREKLLKGDRQILIKEGTINNGTVIIPDDTRIILKPGGRVIEDLSGYVTRRVLVLRVSTIGSNQTYTTDELSHNFFADNDLTLKSQYAACSHGKLTFEPVSSNVSDHIEGGVLDVELNVTAHSMERNELGNLAIGEAERLIGNNLIDVANNIIICQPPDSLGDWVAYAYVHQPYSVYKGEWCGFISANMHEVGHNLGFKHSNLPAAQGSDGIYGDRTDYMGWSYPRQKWPAMCFNAQKNWQTGWFADKALHIDVSNGVWSGKLATFVDYDNAKDDEYVVIKVGEKLYFQYNRAKGMNAQTHDRPNELVVVESKLEGTELLGGLDGNQFNSTFFQYNNFENSNKTLFITICSRHDGNNITDADYFQISVGLDAIDCNVTMSPSESPSLSPSSSPSASRVYAGHHPDRGQLCDDDMEQEIAIPGFLNIKCSFLQNSPEGPVRDFLCNTTRASEVCMETCGTCSDSCKDEGPFFHYEKGFQDCEWLRTQPNFESLCRPGDTPRYYCRETCNSCESCTDNNEDSFNILWWGEKNCTWVNSMPEDKKSWWLEYLCVPDQKAYDTCSKTCGRCEAFPECHDSTSEFTYRGERHNCDWLASELKPDARKTVCQRRHIMRKCRSTCGTCTG